MFFLEKTRHDPQKELVYLVQTASILVGALNAMLYLSASG